MRKNILKIMGSLLIIGFLAACGSAPKASGVTNNNGFEFGAGDFNGQKYLGITGYNGTQKDIVIPQRINNLPVFAVQPGAFDGKGLESVEFPDSFAEVGIAAFANNNLVSIWLDAVNIRERAFMNNNIGDVNLGPHVKKIGSLAFYGNKITHILIGANVDIGRAHTDGTTVDFSGADFEGEGGYIDAFGYENEDSFYAFYNYNGKKTGLYVWDGAKWEILGGGDNETAASGQTSIPDMAVIHNNNGGDLLRKGNYDMAIVAFNMAIESDPNYAIAYGNRGHTYYMKGDYDRAIADFSQTINLDPNDAAAYNGRGVAYNKKGDHDKAIADYSQAINLDPTDIAAYINRGYAYYDTGDYDRAIADFEQALRLDPNNALAKTGLVNAEGRGR
ncbi:MAG: tetratricopeptide repeat protein [Treponema sp.]|jgi:tetratricopeptide (TPR) repeat protein|nr:tetratricopeptide repeat protein [Treponema sp.]